MSQEKRTGLQGFLYKLPALSTLSSFLFNVDLGNCPQSEQSHLLRGQLYIGRCKSTDYTLQTTSYSLSRQDIHPRLSQDSSRYSPELKLQSIIQPTLTHTSNASIVLTEACINTHRMANCLLYLFHIQKPPISPRYTAVAAVPGKEFPHQPRQRPLWVDGPPVRRARLRQHLLVQLVHAVVVARVFMAFVAHVRAVVAFLLLLVVVVVVRIRQGQVAVEGREVDALLLEEPGQGRVVLVLVRVARAALGRLGCC